MTEFTDDPSYLAAIKSKPLLELGKAFAESHYDTGNIFLIYLHELEVSYNWDIDLLVIDRILLFESSWDLHDKICGLLTDKAKNNASPELTDEEKTLKMAELIEKLKKNDALDTPFEPEVVLNALSGITYE